MDILKQAPSLLSLALFFIETLFILNASFKGLNYFLLIAINSKNIAYEKVIFTYYHYAFF